MAQPWDDTKALKLVRDRFSMMQDFRSGYEANWNSFYKLYRAKRAKTRTDKSGRRMSNLFIPKVFSYIETEMAKIMDAFFASRPVIAVQPREQKDIENARIAEGLLDYQMFHIPFFELKFSNFLRDHVA